MVQECASRFSFLAAGPLSAARGRALAPTRATSPLKTRVGVLRCPASGQHPRRRRQRAINAPGSRACGYKTVSGRRKFLNPDPTGFKGGLNFYAAFNGNPVSYRDPSGLGAVGDNQNLASWLNNSSTTPVDLSNPFGVQAGYSSLNYETTSTAIGGLGVAGSALEFSPLGAATIGDNGVLYLSGWGGGSRGLITTYKVAPILKTGGVVLAGAGFAWDTYGVIHGDIAPVQYTANTVVAGSSLYIGGPVGASLAGGYFVGGLIQKPVNCGVEQTFQIFTDRYYGTPYGPAPEQ